MFRRCNACFNLILFRYRQHELLITKVFLIIGNYPFKPFFIVPDIILRHRNLFTKHGYSLIIFGRVSVVWEK